MGLLLVVTFIFRGEKHEKYTVFMVMSDSFGLLLSMLYGQFVMQKPNPSVYLRVGKLPIW